MFLVVIRYFDQKKIFLNAKMTIKMITQLWQKKYFVSIEIVD